MDCIDLILSFTQTLVFSVKQTKCDVLDVGVPFYFCVLGFLVDVKIWTVTMTLTIKCTFDLEHKHKIEVLQPPVSVAKT